jgi:hypothetical protein
LNTPILVLPGPFLAPVILNAVVVIVVVLWLLQVFGVLPAISTLRAG